MTAVRAACVSLKDAIWDSIMNDDLLTATTLTSLARSLGLIGAQRICFAVSRVLFILSFTSDLYASLLVVTDLPRYFMLLMTLKLTCDTLPLDLKRFLTEGDVLKLDDLSRLTMFPKSSSNVIVYRSARWICSMSWHLMLRSSMNMPLRTLPHRLSRQRHQIEAVSFTTWSENEHPWPKPLVGEYGMPYAPLILSVTIWCRHISCIRNTKLGSQPMCKARC